MLGCVYLTVNNINGKCYIGQTLLPVRRNYIGSGTLFKRARSKYGRHNFSFSILEEFDSQQELDQSEIDHISIMKSYGCDLYNLSSGGRSIGGGRHSRESIEKIRKKLTGRSFTKEHRKNLSESFKRIPYAVQQQKLIKRMEAIKIKGGFSQDHKNKLRALLNEGRRKSSERAKFLRDKFGPRKRMPNTNIIMSCSVPPDIAEFYFKRSAESGETICKILGEILIGYYKNATST